jgi:large subunit ribosomal protein L31e
VADEEEERIMTIPLRKVISVPRKKRAPRAVRAIKEYVMRHMKAGPEDIWIDARVNEAVWARGIQKPPNKIRVKVIKFEDGLVEVSLPEG